MFGFLDPRGHDLDYRSIYSRACQHQHLNYGTSSLAFHSFEGVFLYSCALDSGAIDESDVPRQTCCKLRTGADLLRGSDHEFGLFCASTGLLLASIKIQDDIRDRGGVGAHFWQWLLRKRIKKAYDYFSTLDPNFRQRIDQFICEHLRMENPGKSVSLSDYAEPTARAFSYLFELMANLPAMGRFRDSLSDLGRHIGTALICHDCAIDWRVDNRLGHYNPLRSEEAVNEAVTSAREHLKVASLCCDAFGKCSRAKKLLQTVCRKLEQADLFEKRTRFQHRWRRIVSLFRANREHVVLNAVCCIPCGDGAVAADSDDCAGCVCTAFGGALCCWFCCCR